VVVVVVVVAGEVLGEVAEEVLVLAVLEVLVLVALIAHSPISERLAHGVEGKSWWRLKGPPNESLGLQRARRNDTELARSGLELDKSGKVWYRSMVLVGRQSSAWASSWV
jgi:hypothetical protein